MKENSISSSVADEQAALWAARLEGSTLTDVDRASLNAWLAESPSHRGLLSGYCQFSADLERQLTALVAAGAIAMPASTPTRRPWSSPRIFAVAGTIAAMLLVAFWWWPTSADGVEEFTAAAAQRRTVLLHDGTRVELDANTTLQFVERGHTRHARLLSGQALFVVSKQPGHPFFVQTDSGEVRVTGTTFEVRTDVASLEVTVLEGTVQVEPRLAGSQASTSFTLAAHDRLSAVAGAVTVRKLSGEALEDALAWRQGIVVFVDEPLETALARFARYQARSVRVTPAAAKLRVSGRYSLDDLDGFLLGIEEPFGIRAGKEPGGDWRVGLRSE